MAVYRRPAYGVGSLESTTLLPPLRLVMVIYCLMTIMIIYCLIFNGNNNNHFENCLDNLLDVNNCQDQYCDRLIKDHKKNILVMILVEIFSAASYLDLYCIDDL